MASCMQDVRSDLVQHQPLIQGDGPVLAQTLVDLLAPSTGQAVDDEKENISTSQINGDVPAFIRCIHENALVLQAAGTSPGDIVPQLFKE